MGLPSGDVTFVFGDIEGSTALWERDPEAMRISLEAHDALIRGAVAAAGGSVFKHTGDGFVAAFADPAAAVVAACDVERGLAHVGPLTLRARIGVHSGEAAPRDGDYFGPEVNRAARLMDTANGGQIVASGATIERLDGRMPPGTTVRDVGSHRLKDLGEPMQIHRIVLADAADHRPLRTLNAGRNNLPEQVTSLVGRTEHATAIADIVREQRLTTLTGIGGVGKTRLALQVAANMVDEFADGVWFIELAAVGEAAMLATTALASIGIKQEAGQDSLVHLLEFLADHDALLVIDNCEHLIDAAAKFVDQLLRGAPNLRVLATSREGLAIAGEHIWRVPSLRADGTAAALELFEARAQLVRPDFVIDASNRAEVASLCERLDGIPLAIELATARLQMLDVDQIAQHLDDRFRLLTSGSRTSAERQRTLLAMMDWSYELLTDREQALLRRLSVFTGGFDLEAAVAVASNESIFEFEVLDLLGRLVETSMVQFEQRPTPRYRLLETVRHYATDRLESAGEADDAREQHAQHYALVARQVAALFLTNAGDALDAGQRELPNMRTAMTWAFDTARTELGLTIAIDAWEYFYNTSRIHESLLWLRRGIERVDAIDSTTTARALAMTITSARNMGEVELAERLADRAAEAIAEVEDEVMQADLINAVGNRMLAADPLGADEHYQKAISLYRANGDSGWVAKLINRFLVLNAAYRPDAGAELLELTRSTGGRTDAVQPEPVEAYLLLHQDRAADALGVLEQVDPQSLHSRAEAMPHCWALVHAHRALGNVAAARAACDAGAEWRVAPLDLAFGLWKDVHVALDEGDLDRAAAIATSAGRESIGVPDPVWHAYFAALWARVSCAAERFEDAALALAHWHHQSHDLGLRLMPYDQRVLGACEKQATQFIDPARRAQLAQLGADAPATEQLLANSVSDP